MRHEINVTHPSGSEMRVIGSRKFVQNTFAQWWNSNNAIVEDTPGEPQKNGAEAQAERAFPRYFESEGIHQDVPIIQGHSNVTPLWQVRTPAGFTGFTVNEETTA